MIKVEFGISSSPDDSVLSEKYAEVMPQFHINVNAMTDIYTMSLFRIDRM